MMMPVLEATDLKWSRQKKKNMVNFTLSLSLSQVFTRYGKCYMFNAAEEGKTLRTTMKGGTGNGLEIMLDIQQDEYLPVWGDTGRHGELVNFSCQINSKLHFEKVPGLNVSKWETRVASK